MKLSKRQAQIAGMIADDQDVPGIAAELQIQEETVRRHLADIRRKKGLSSTVQIANLIWKQRLKSLRRKPTYNDVDQPVNP